MFFEHVLSLLFLAFGETYLYYFEFISYHFAMKKFFAVLMACIIAIPTFSYTTLESSIADYLAQKNIIQDHRSEVSRYRLNDNISRQEVVALAMKISGTSMDAPCR